MDHIKQIELQGANLKNLLDTGAFQFINNETPWFPYTSGEVGPYYVQSVAVEKDGAAYAFAVESIVKLIEADFSGFDVISGGETRDWDFSNPVAFAMRKPHLKLYKNGKALGASVTGKKVLHVADLNNEGSSVRDYWLPMIKSLGGELAGVVFFVDRNEDGVAVLDSLGLKHGSVVLLDEPAWKVVLESGCISRTVYEGLVRRIADKRAWAISALMDNPAYFLKFKNDKATREKAVKIQRTYPETANISGAD